MGEFVRHSAKSAARRADLLHEDLDRLQDDMAKALGSVDLIVTDLRRRD